MVCLQEVIFIIPLKQSTMLRVFKVMGKCPRVELRKPLKCLISHCTWNTVVTCCCFIQLCKFYACTKYFVKGSCGDDTKIKEQNV